ncbi:intracellular serine protease [Fusarium bulbicola]|nr:intracellular serine protease [Fusarium bulbicola]
MKSGGQAGPAAPMPDQVQAPDSVTVFLDKIEGTDWNDKKSLDSLKDFIIKGDKLLMRLIEHDTAKYYDNNNNNNNSVWYSDKGQSLLSWMMGHEILVEHFYSIPVLGKGDEFSNKLPIPLAITQKNWAFLACLLRVLYDHNDLSRSKKMGSLDAILERQAPGVDGNCLHSAMSDNIPFVSFMAAVCSPKALRQPNLQGCTPLHIAMVMGVGKAPVKPIPPLPKSLSATKKEAAGDFDDDTKDEPRWNEAFNPYDIFQEITKRQDAKEVLTEVLTVANNDGKSPYQLAMQNQPEYLQEEMKRCIFQRITGIQNVSKALYGTSGEVKDLCLDMSDFNQSSHNFDKFVERLTLIDEGAAEESTLQFENSLFFVQLPDLNYVKPACQHDTFRKLFHWLKDRKKVKSIKKLSIPDNTTTPMSDTFFDLYILRNFELSVLDWRKKDIDLGILTGSTYENINDSPGRQQSLTELTLYSSGNWGVLYHWISENGLALLPLLSKVQINIVHLNPVEGVHDAITKKEYSNLSKVYKKRLEDCHARFQEQYKGAKDLNFEYKLDVVVDAPWDYPLPPQTSEPTARAPKHHFTGQLKYCGNLLKSQERKVKVAIIDNGADRIRMNIGEMIARGVSYVTADPIGSDQILPWWMVSDAHGTQMASWALEQKVDIISMSWTTKMDDPELAKAVQEAANPAKGRPTLMFCSTADEGMYSEDTWPVKYEHVVKVSATDKWGHRTNKTHGPEDVDVMIPGENIEADAPIYMGQTLPTVSGSSVATALAAGIASLALMMIEKYNQVSERDMESFYTRAGIKKVFKKMDAEKGGIQLFKLFPKETINSMDTDDRMKTNWKISNLK